MLHDFDTIFYFFFSHANWKKERETKKNLLLFRFFYLLFLLKHKL